MLKSATAPQLEIRKASQRGVAEHGWLSSRHTFSFASYYDPTQVGFSDLLVINDDTVAAAKGFGTHGHNDMEIFSYVLQGTLAHKDSMGQRETITANEVQMMSAGSGITHSEYNASTSEPVHFLQIWIVPDRKNVAPRYQQRLFTVAEKQGKLRLIISAENQPDVLNVYQNVHVYAGCFDGMEQAEYTIPEGRYTYVHVAQGQIELNGVQLQAGDGVKIRETGQLTLAKGRAAEVLLFDLNAKEHPSLR